MSASRPGRAVAIVGAGVSGVVTAGVLSRVGYDVVVFEQAPDVGGVWSATRSYPGIATQDDRGSYTFSGKRMPAHVAEHPLGGDVREYLREYLAESAPEADVRLSTRVRSAERTDEGLWTVESDGPDGRRVDVFD